MTEKQEKFLELLGIIVGKKFKIKGLDNCVFCFKELEENKLLLYYGDEGNKCGMSSFIFSKLLTSDIELIEEPILTDKEKEYLENVCRPFKDRIVSFVKATKLYTNEKYEYLMISIRNNDIALLPSFKLGEMYKGMKNDKKYTLKELGLFENE